MESSIEVLFYFQEIFEIKFYIKLQIYITRFQNKIILFYLNVNENLHFLKVLICVMFLLIILEYNNKTFFILDLLIFLLYFQQISLSCHLRYILHTCLVKILDNFIMLAYPLSPLISHRILLNAQILPVYYCLLIGHLHCEYYICFFLK